MTNIIVAFQNQEDGKNIKNILVKNGFSVAAQCSSGSQVLSLAGDLQSGIVVSSFGFGDMICRQLRMQLSERFSLLVIAAPGRLSGQKLNDIVCLSVPLRVCELVSTVRMLEETRFKKRGKQKNLSPMRSEKEQSVINQAKELLAVRNGMTEPEAHRYLQKCSMDGGSGLAEAAAMVLRLYQ